MPRRRGRSSDRQRPGGPTWEPSAVRMSGSRLPAPPARGGPSMQTLAGWVGGWVGVTVSSFQPLSN
jgi:hypothetical protein